jgi:hypothetical protein
MNSSTIVRSDRGVGAVRQLGHQRERQIAQCSIIPLTGAAPDPLQQRLLESAQRR